MPIIIAIDTASDTASVTVQRDSNSTTRYSKGVSTHSQAVLPMLDALLTEAGLALPDVDAIAFDCGPGSFTGVRTACGVAQGLSLALEKPLIPIVSLLAMAESCHQKNHSTDVLAILDARMQEVYWAQYRIQEGQWTTISEPAITPASSVVPAGNPDACGNGLTAYPDAFAALPVQAKYPEIFPDSAAVAALAKKASERGESIHPRDAQPLYIRNKVAYTTAERRTMKKEAAC